MVQSYVQYFLRLLSARMQPPLLASEKRKQHEQIKQLLLQKITGNS
jgi:hypothetical protein